MIVTFWTICFACILQFDTDLRSSIRKRNINFLLTATVHVTSSLSLCIKPRPRTKRKTECTLAPSFQSAKFQPPTESRTSLKKGDLSKQLTAPQWTLNEDSGGEANRGRVQITFYTVEFCCLAITPPPNV